MNIGKLHVLVVHFPIALALSALLADLLWLAARKECFKHAGGYCLLLAALTAAPAVLTGLAVAGSKDFAGDYLSLVVAHKWRAIATLTVLVLAAVVRLLPRKSLAGWRLVGYCVLIAAAAVGAALTGHSGGMLVYGEDFLSGIF